MSEKVLIIDDDEHTVWVVSNLLKAKGYDVIEALTPEAGLKAAYQRHPDLILLDIMMPGMDGWEVCRRLREMTEVPLIFLTARTSVKEVVRGLELGADDYVQKPFDKNELLARVRAQLRRKPTGNVEEELSFDNGALRIKVASREVIVRGEQVKLTPKEFDLLKILARNAGRVLTRSELISQAWGPEYNDGGNSLKLYIHYLRRKIEVDPDNARYIHTLHGVGYRFANLQNGNGT